MTMLPLTAVMVTLSYSALELKLGAMTMTSSTAHPLALSTVISVSPANAEDVSLV